MESVNEGAVETPAAETDDVNALLEQVYKPEPPMNEVKPEAETKAEQAERMFKLKRGDEVLEKPESEVINLAQKGFDYEVNNRLLRQERELLELKKKELEPYDANRLKELAQLDDYAKQNPKFLDAVKQAWQKFQTGDPVKPEDVVTPLWDRLSQMESTLNEIKTEKKIAMEQKEDAELENSLKELRSKYPEINMDEKDELGFTHEHKVLQHITNHGFPTAKAAFLDLYADKITELRANKAVDSKLKEIQDRYNKGFVLNKKLVASNALTRSKEMKDLSYDDLYKQSVKELGLGG